MPADGRGLGTGQVGSPPGGPNTTFAIAAIRDGTGTKIEPYWVAPPDLISGDAEDDPASSTTPPICSASAASSGRRSGGRSVRTVAPTAASSFGRLNRIPAPDRAIAERDEDLLLAGGAGQVALAGRLADPGVGEGVGAVEVVRPGLDRPAAPAVEAAVVRVGERLLRRRCRPRRPRRPSRRTRRGRPSRSSGSGSRTAPRRRPRASATPPCGKSAGWRSAKLISELIFGPKVSPLPSGTPARSRGIETIDTVRPTGSSETTISESVSASVRPGAESTPIEQDVEARLVERAAGRVEIERTVDPPKIWANIACAALP